MTNELNQEPSVLGSIWRYRWLMLLLSIAFAGLGWLYATNNESWSATASMVVQDPRASTLFSTAFGDAPERYVADQAALVRSRTVATEAAELAALETPPVVLEPEAIIKRLAVTTSSASNLLTLTYTDATPRVAVAGVNAVAEAYRQIGKAAAATGFAAAITELDGEISDLEAALLRLDAEVIDLSVVAPLDAELEAEIDDLTGQLDGFNAISLGATTSQVAASNQRVELLRLRLETVQAQAAQQRVAAQQLTAPFLAEALDQQAAAKVRLRDLQKQRDDLAVDANLAGSGIAFLDPAELAQPSSVGLYVVLGFLLGATIAAGIATVFARRKRRFEDRNEPGKILEAPLLADIPNFREERLKTLLPVVDAPASASAEAFRFVSSTISLRQLRPVRDDGARHFKIIATTSAGLAEGKTVATANTAFASAREGNNVLVIDADFGHQELTRLLLGDDTEPPLGLTDVAAGSLPLSEALIEVDGSAAGNIKLLTRGRDDVRAPDFFSSPNTERLLKDIADEFDLVVIDGPPLLRVAYATSLLRIAERTLEIVTHGEDIQAVEELKQQLDLIGIPAIGYLYNMAPLRAEMTVSEGSMADSLGTYVAPGTSKDGDGDKDGQSEWQWKRATDSR